MAGQRHTADGRLVGALKHAHGAGMKNKHWWQKALDLASDALAKITIVLMVVALVAIVVLAIVQPELIPGLLLLAGQILTGLSAAQLAVDGTRKATGDNVSWGSLGLDALGLLPGIGKLGQLADSVPVLSRGAEALRGAGQTVRSYSTAFARSLATDLKATRYVIRIADTGTGTTLMTGIEHQGKTTSQMLTDAKAAAASARTANVETRFVIVEGAGTTTRTINFRPQAADPNWGLTKAHLDKHLFGPKKLSLRQIDPSGNADVWLDHLQKLASREPTSTGKDGIIDIVGEFPRTGEVGTFRLGLRLSPNSDGTYDLVTLLTRQGGK
ncbi:MAG: hypothetical protein ABI140_04240 [Jatrophihabitantaceae bacterium]